MKKDLELDKLEAELKRAWRQSSETQIPDGWMNRVMASVHKAASRRNPSPEADQAYHRIVFRCATLAACVALVFVVLIPKNALNPSNELVRLVMQDPAGFLRQLPFDF